MPRDPGGDTSTGPRSPRPPLRNVRGVPDGRRTIRRGRAAASEELRRSGRPIRGRPSGYPEGGHANRRPQQGVATFTSDSSDVPRRMSTVVGRCTCQPETRSLTESVVDASTHCEAGPVVVVEIGVDETDVQIPVEGRKVRVVEDLSKAQLDAYAGPEPQHGFR